MLVTAWAGSATAARLAERELILSCLREGHALLNVERERLDRQALLV
jgi:hypothetical protein